MPQPEQFSENFEHAKMTTVNSYGSLGSLPHTVAHEQKQSGPVKDHPVFVLIVICWLLTHLLADLLLGWSALLVARIATAIPVVV